MRSADDVLRDRALGCFAGLAVGDALGTTLEFTQRDASRVDDIVGGGPFGLKPGEWTDDTSMALCLADSLLACGTLDELDLMQRFLRWRRDGENSVTGSCFDIGAATSGALSRFEETGNPLAGSTHERSGGNGSIMRLAPVVLRWHNDRESALDAARRQSRTTHGATAAVEGAAFLADVLLDAIATGDKAYALRARDAAGVIAPVAAGSWRRSREQISSSGYAVHTLEAALWAVDAAGDFQTVALNAANLGDDADSVAAVAGQIAGAIWGYSGIPEKWRAVLAWRERIEELGSALFTAALTA